MKKVIRTAAAIALLFVSTTIMAKEPKLSSEVNSKNVIFQWDNQMGDASVRIVDDKGNIIYSDNLNKIDTYIKNFNLETLEEGNYLLEVENSMREINYFIEVTKNDAVIVDSEENLKPFYKRQNGLVFLNFMNYDMEEVKITIYDACGRKLFRETIKDSLIVEKAFNFNDAFEGVYTIIIRSDSQTFYKTVVIN